MVEELGVIKETIRVNRQSFFRYTSKRKVTMTINDEREKSRWSTTVMLLICLVKISYEFSLKSFYRSLTSPPFDSFL